MSMITRVAFPHVYIKDNGLWVSDLLPPEDKIFGNYRFVTSSLVLIPARRIGGSHKHERVELFGAIIGELELSVMNDSENQESVVMNLPDENMIYFYLIPSNLVHRVKNLGKTNGMMVEFATDKNNEVTKIDLWP